MMNAKNASGVYEICNTVNGKRYIGSTRNLSRRFRQHLSDLKGGRHVNKNLLADWQLHGESAFSFSTLAILESRELLSTEQRIFDALVKDGVACYNYFSHVVSPTIGTHLSLEHRAKISEKNKGIPKSLETRLRMSIARLGKKFPAVVNKSAQD